MSNAGNLSDAVKAPLKNTLIALAIIAGVFFLMTILLIVAATKSAGFPLIMIIISLVIFFVVGVLATMLAVFIDSLINNVDVAMDRVALAKSIGPNFLNALAGQPILDASGNFVAAPTPAAAGGTPNPPP